MADQNGEGAQTTPVAPGADGQSGAASGGDGSQAAATSTLLTGGDQGGAPAGEGGQDGKAKGGEGGNTEADKGEGDKAKAEGPPEKYEFTMPDGVELDAKLVEQFDPVLRDLKLTNEQANKLAGVLATARAADAKAAEEAFAEQVAGWAKQAQDDKELGGAAFDENVRSAQKAIAAFASPELKTLLDSTGLGNHPELLKFCMRIGKAIGEDTHNGTASAGGGQRSLADRLWGSKT